jgi:hypothetical protein
MTSEVVQKLAGGWLASSLPNAKRAIDALISRTPGNTTWCRWAQTEAGTLTGYSACSRSIAGTASLRHVVTRAGMPCSEDWPRLVTPCRRRSMVMISAAAFSKRWLRPLVFRPGAASSLMGLRACQSVVGRPWAERTVQLVRGLDAAGLCPYATRIVARETRRGRPCQRT